MSAIENIQPVDTGMLRFSSAGSVDDGKSTLIGRLLYDTKAIFEDQLSSIEKSTKRRGQTGIDLSLLTDGLLAEREQGITIDVAYRYFATRSRKFIIADSPGHEQYTRNMAADAVAAPRLHREPAAHSACRAGGEQDGPGRPFAEGFRRHQQVFQ